MWFGDYNLPQIYLKDSYNNSLYNPRIAGFQVSNILTPLVRTIIQAFLIVVMSFLPRLT